MTFVLAAVGAKALWLLYMWLARRSPPAGSPRKGYGEKAGSAPGCCLTRRRRDHLADRRRRSQSELAKRGRRTPKAGERPADAETPVTTGRITRGHCAGQGLVRSGCANATPSSSARRRDGRAGRR